MRLSVLSLGVLSLGVLSLGAALAVGTGPASAQPLPVDGVYAGTSSIAGGTTGRSTGRCPQTFQFKLHVRDRTFLWKLPTSQQQVTIGPDGSFSAQNASRFISGQVQAGHLQAQTTGRSCNYIWSLDRE